MMESYLGTILKSLVIIFLASAGLAQAQEGPPKQTGNKVKLSLLVTDQANHSIDALKKEDVHVVDDGVPQILLTITKDERPVDYALVIDNSGSFRDVLEPAIEAAKLIIGSNRAEDETFIERFISSEKIETVQEFTSEKGLLTKGLDTLYVEKGQSAVIDALYLAIDHTAQYHRGDDSRRQAVVVFTDCEERDSYYSNKKLIKLIQTNRVQVFVIGIVYLLNKNGGLFISSPREKAERLAKLVADESGGRYFLPKDTAELVEATKQIIHDLHMQFMIGYERQGKSDEKNFRRIKVSLTGSEQRTATAPSGYSIHPPAPP